MTPDRGGKGGAVVSFPHRLAKSQTLDASLLLCDTFSVSLSSFGVERLLLLLFLLPIFCTSPELSRQQSYKERGKPEEMFPVCIYVALGEEGDGKG